MTSLLEQVCVSCRQGFHDECDDFWQTRLVQAEWIVCCCSKNFDLIDFFDKERRDKAKKEFAGQDYVDKWTDEPIDTYIPNFGGTKAPQDYVDPLSSGRKKAARVAPIKAGDVCEWAWLKNAGGGIVPIIGCPGRPASDRHHGPDKNTLHNELSTNLHRICDWCHNQWHAKNDPHYGPRPTNPDGSVDASLPFLPDGEVLPHDPFTRESDEVVYQEDMLRREEARKHGADI
jgi:hypothetical protein